MNQIFIIACGITVIVFFQINDIFAFILPEPQPSFDANNWPSVFVLSRDPSFPVVCFAGKSSNFTSPSLNERTTTPPLANNSSDNNNKTSSYNGDPNIFILSSDPHYPVVCKIGQLPGNLSSTFQSNSTSDLINGDDDDRNITCIRRDYEQNVSVIILFEPGRLQHLWNVFNSSLPYDFNNVQNPENITQLKIIREKPVECSEYIFGIGDKSCSLSSATLAALCGQG